MGREDRFQGGSGLEFFPLFINGRALTQPVFDLLEINSPVLISRGGTI